MQAAGVHVGNEDASPVFLRSQEAFRNRIIGYVVEATEQVHSDKALAADYLGISPVSAPLPQNQYTHRVGAGRHRSDPQPYG
ncbi:MAG: thiamine phosphate synthase [Chitinophagaceae bacterium]